MANIGSSTFDSLIPDITDIADIQKAFKLYHFGNTELTQTSGQGIWGHLTSISSLIATKANIASPTFTGTVTMPAGTISSVALKLVAGTNLTTPVAGAVEFDGTNLYFTPSSLSRKTVAFTDSNITGTAAAAQSVLYYGGASGSMNYSAPNKKIFTGSTPPSSGVAVGDIWMW